MNEEMVIQRPRLHRTDIDSIRWLIQENPSWHRTRISKEICKLRDWKRPDGQFKYIACCSMLRKLQDRGLLILPKPLHAGHYQRKIREVPHNTEPVRDSLSAIRPIRLVETHSRPDRDNLFCHLFPSMLASTMVQRFPAAWTAPARRAMPAGGSQGLARGGKMISSIKIFQSLIYEQQ